MLRIVISMTADGNCFIVGADEDEDNGTESGSVYVYKWNGSSWDETKITASDGINYDNFGESVSMAADGNFIAGASGHDDKTGAVYVY